MWRKDIARRGRFQNVTDYQRCDLDDHDVCASLILMQMTRVTSRGSAKHLENSALVHSKRRMLLQGSGLESSNMVVVSQSSQAQKHVRVMTMHKVPDVFLYEIDVLSQPKYVARKPMALGGQRMATTDEMKT